MNIGKLFRNELIVTCSFVKSYFIIYLLYTFASTKLNIKHVHWSRNTKTTGGELIGTEIFYEFPSGGLCLLSTSAMAICTPGGQSDDKETSKKPKGGLYHVKCDS